REYARIISGGGPIHPAHLPQNIRTAGAAPPTLSLAAAPAEGAGPAPALPRTLKEIEMEHVLRVVEKHNNNKPAAAAELGISLKTLYNKLNSLEERNSAG